MKSTIAGVFPKNLHLDSFCNHIRQGIIIDSAETLQKLCLAVFSKNLTETLYYLTFQAQITNVCLKNSFGLKDHNKIPAPLLLLL